MAGLAFSDGSVTVRMDDGFIEAAERILQQIAAGELKRLRTEGDAILAEAKKRWPVSKGYRPDHPNRHSRDELYAGVVVVGDFERLRLRISNTADWWVYVSPRWAYGKLAIAELVRKPVRKLGQTIIRERLAAIDELG